MQPLKDWKREKEKDRQADREGEIAIEMEVQCRLEFGIWMVSTDRQWNLAWILDINYNINEWNE